MRRLLLVAAAVALAACSKHDKSPAPAHTAPWHARPAPSAARPSLVVRYTIDPRGSASFTLKAKKATPRGTLRVARGTLQVDLLDLTKTRGTVSMDLGSVLMDADAGVDAGDQDPTDQAKNWLDVGDNVPEAERARQRWATFHIESIDHATADAAYEGRRAKPSALSPDGGAVAETPDAGDGGAAPPEIRSVDLTATGRLFVHGFEAHHSVRLRALFEFAGKAGPGARPERIVIRSLHPLALPLAAYGIKPRDSAGIFVSEGMKLLGVSVGREALISLDLSAVPASGARGGR